MGSVLATATGHGGLGGGSRLAGATTHGAPHGGGSVFGHLVGDIKDTVLGIGPGLYGLATHPLRAAENIGRAYAQTYGPLIHGDFGEFAHQVGMHPLGPALDVATLFTGGIGGAARVARGAAEAGALSEGSLAARLAEYTTPRQLSYVTPGMRAGDRGALLAGPIKGKALSRNPVIRARQEAVNKALNLLPYAPEDAAGKISAKASGLLGEGARATREELAQARKLNAGVKLQAAAYNQAVAKLDKHERQALYPLAVLPLPRSLANWQGMLHEAAAAGSEDAQHTLGLLDNPKVKDAYLNPSPALQAARDEADRLGQAMVDHAVRTNTMTAGEAAQAVWRQSRLADGAATYTARQARAITRSIDGELGKLGRTREQVQALSTQLRDKGTPELRGRNRIDKIHADLANVSDRLARYATGQELSSDELLAAGLKPGSDVGKLRDQLIGKTIGEARQLTGKYEAQLAKLPTDVSTEQARTDMAARLVAGRQELERIAQSMDELAKQRGEIRPGIGGGDVNALRAELQAAGRPEPIYFPDQRLTPVARPQVGAASGLVAGNPVNESSGMLFLAGQVAMDPSVLNRQFLRVAAHTHYRDVVDRMLSMATAVRGTALPDGYVWVKEPKAMKALGIDDAAGIKLSESDLFTTDANGSLHKGTGTRYALPASMARKFGAEFKRSEQATRWWLDKPLDVWRALVLHLRVGWLVNNVVGNTLMAAIQFAGPAGLRAYANMILNAKGPTAVRRMLNIADPNGLSDDLFRSRFPEQAGGTFIGTQLPESSRAGRATRAVTAIPGKTIVKADRAYEQGLRKASAETAIRRTPEFKKLSRQMRSETRDFDTIAAKVLDDPAIAREVSDKVNAALGDFLNLSPLERTTIRRLAPFYAWYKAIAGVTLKLATDTPGRADALRMIGQIGEQQLQEEFGGPVQDFLKGFIPFGKTAGGVSGLNLTSANPYGTSIQLGQAVGGLVGGKPGTAGKAVGGELNPFAQSFIEWLSGHQLYNGATAKPTKIGPVTLPGLPGYLARNFTNAPQLKPLQRVYGGPVESPLYGQRDAVFELLGMLGVRPVDVNAARARATG